MHANQPDVATGLTPGQAQAMIQVAAIRELSHPGLRSWQRRLTPPIQVNNTGTPVLTLRGPRGRALQITPITDDPASLRYRTDWTGPLSHTDFLGLRVLLYWLLQGHIPRPANP